MAVNGIEYAAIFEMGRLGGTPATKISDRQKVDLRKFRCVLARNPRSRGR